MNMNDLVTALKERFTSPVLGTFTTIWLITNWQIPIAIIFGEEETSRTILISRYLDQVSFSYVMILPLFLTICLIPLNIFCKALYSYILNKYLYYVKLLDQRTEKKLMEMNSYGATLFEINGALLQLLNSQSDFLMSLQIESDKFSKDLFVGNTYKSFHSTIKTEHEHLLNKMEPFQIFNKGMSEYSLEHMLTFLKKIGEHRLAKKIASTIQSKQS